MRRDYDEITRVTDDFCHQLLDDEYAEICRRIAAALCRKRPSPVAQGNLTHWVTGIIHAAGLVNCLWDPSQKPYMRAAEISERFNVGNGTTVARSKVIQQALGLFSLDPRYYRASILADNPLVWFVEINGVILDAWDTAREIQEELVRRGIIPFVCDAPAEPESLETPRAQAPRRASTTKPAKPEDPNQGRLFAPADNSPG